MNKASKQFNNLEKRYLKTSENIDDFNHDYVYGFMIMSEPQVKFAKKLHAKRLPELRKVYKKYGYHSFGILINGHAPKSHAEIQEALDSHDAKFIDTDSVISRILDDTIHQVYNDFKHNLYLVNWNYFTVHEITMNDLPLLEKSLQGCLADSNEDLNLARVILLDNYYSTNYISKETKIPTKAITMARYRARHQDGDIDHLSIKDCKALENFYRHSGLPHHLRNSDAPIFKGFNDGHTNIYNEKHHIL